MPGFLSLFRKKKTSSSGSTLSKSASTSENNKLVSDTPNDRERLDSFYGYQSYYEAPLGCESQVASTLHTPRSKRVRFRRWIRGKVEPVLVRVGSSPATIPVGMVLGLIVILLSSKLFNGVGFAIGLVIGCLIAPMGIGLFEYSNRRRYPIRYPVFEDILAEYYIAAHNPPVPAVQIMDDDYYEDYYDDDYYVDEDDNIYPL